MRELLEPTQDPGWMLSHDGYDVLSESAIESRLAFGNGFLGMRAARSVSRGPTWVGWLGYSRWASWPRCYVAGLFDVPNTEPPVPALVPVADWSRVRILLDGEPLLAQKWSTRLCDAAERGGAKETHQRIRRMKLDYLPQIATVEASWHASRAKRSGRTR